MADTPTDVRDRIIAWLDGAAHEGDCGYWAPDGSCNCDMQELNVAVRAVLDLHGSQDRGTGPQCTGCATHVTFTSWPCATVRAVADALGVST